MRTFSRRIASVLFLTFGLLLLLGAACAEDVPASGTLTINPANSPANSSQTYTLYKLFDAEVVYDGNGNVAGVNYTVPEGKESKMGYSQNKAFELDENGYVVTTEDFDVSMLSSDDFRKWVTTFSFGTLISAQAAGDDGKVVFNNLDFGYYWIDSTLGTAVSVTSVTPERVIHDKNNPPELEKIITAINGEAADNIYADGHKASVQIGDVVTYQITIIAKPGAENYKFVDQLSDGMTLVRPTSNMYNTVQVSPAKWYNEKTKQELNTATSIKWTSASNAITVSLASGFLSRVTEPTPITFTYSVIVNENAVIGPDGNPNTVTLTYGHKPEGERDYLTDDAIIYIGQLAVNKYDAADPKLKLEGVGFALKNAEGLYYFYDEENSAVTWIEDETAATLHTDENGQILFSGLANGTYTLVETAPLAGYSKAEDSKIIISNQNNTEAELMLTANVPNSSGSVLPSTGGSGTAAPTLAGCLLTLTAAALLAAQKRARRAA